MKDQTEAAIRNIASIDGEITKAMLDRAIDILRGEMAGRNDLVHVMKRRDVMKHLKIHRRTLDYYLEKGYLKRVYGGGRKTALGMALAFGIVPEAARGAVEARLVQAVEREGCHVDMGLLGMKHVFRALARMGRADLAWRMILNPTWPGPTYWIQRGGTTLWEDWKSGASRNHVMFADYVGWAYQYLAGIRLAEDESSTSAVTVPVEGGEGFREIEIAPCPVEGLAWVKASVQSPRGCIASEWRVEKSRFELTVTIPKSVRARVRLPDGSVREVQAGRTTLSCCL